MESQRSRASIASGTAGRYGAIEQNAINDDQDRSLEPWLLPDLFQKIYFKNMAQDLMILSMKSMMMFL